MEKTAKLLLLLLFLAILTNVHCQQIDSLSYKSDKAPDHEALTLRLYYEAKWDSLLVAGQAAIKDGQDYFFIQIRTGAAAYYSGNYSLAAIYLENAHHLNITDDFTTELLYFSYIYTGRLQQAWLLRKDMSEALKLRLEKTIGGVFFFEAGPIISDGEKHAGKLMSDDGMTFSDKYYERSALYFVTGWRQPVHERYWITASASYLDFSKHRDVEIKYLDSLSGNYRVSQVEFYLSPSVTLNRFTISPSFRITDTRVTEPIFSTDTITRLYLGLPIAKKFNDYVLGAELLYSSHYWKGMAGSWYLKAGDVKTWQITTSLVWLPLGNLNLYTVSNLTWKTAFVDRPLVVSQSCGFKVLSNTWLELSGTYGNVAATTEFNGQLLNNQINNSQYRISSILLLDLSERIRLSFRYQYMRNESMAWFLDDEYKLLERSYNYNRHIITGGLSWNVF